jgi:hypothetical protein
MDNQIWLRDQALIAVGDTVSFRRCGDDGRSGADEAGGASVGVPASGAPLDSRGHDVH